MLRVEARYSPDLHCPYCRSDISDQGCETCARCETTSHSECIELHGNCPVFACAEPPSGVTQLNALLLPPNNDVDHSFFSDVIAISFLLLFGVVMAKLTPAIATMHLENGVELPWYTDSLHALFGSFGGWSTALLTGYLITLNRALIRRYPNFREQINEAFVCFLLFVAPCIISICFFSPMLTLMNKL